MRRKRFPRNRTGGRAAHGHAAHQIGLSTLLLLPLGALGQSTVNVSGYSGTLEGNTYAYAIGEMAVVGTTTGGDLTVTQGVLQGSPVMGSGVEEAALSGEVMRIWPNPVSDMLFLQPAMKGGGELHIELHDGEGRLVLEREIHLDLGSELQQIDMGGLSIGTYFLTATSHHGQHQVQMTYKVMKSGAGR